MGITEKDLSDETVKVVRWNNAAYIYRGNEMISGPYFSEAQINQAVEKEDPAPLQASYVIQDADEVLSGAKEALRAMTTQLSQLKSFNEAIHQLSKTLTNQGLTSTKENTNG